MTGPATAPVDAAARAWRLRILTSTWLSYAGYYVCRKNFAIVKGVVRDAMEISNSELAHIFSVYLVTYMLGQFITGFAGRKVATRLLLLGGMAITLLCNVAFGFSSLMGPAGYWPLLLLMGVNGFAQATGWPGNVGVLGNWLRQAERGRVMAVWATSYQIGSIVAKGFATLMLGLGGALWSFWGAALVMVGVWLLFFFLERDHPEDVGLPPLAQSDPVPEGASASAGVPVAGGVFAGWDRRTFTTVLWMGACYFVFKFLRYALDSWSPLVMAELFAIDRVRAGYLSTLFDWVGFVGVLFAGWLSDRFFAGRRYQTIFLMTCGMLAAFVFLAVFGVRSIWLFGTGLALCGFMLMGPDSLLSGVGAIDVGGRQGAVLAAGMINGIGSIGPILQEETIGIVLDRYGYLTSFYIMIGVAALGVVATAYLASRSRRRLSTL